MRRPLWWVTIGLAVVAIAVFGRGGGQAIPGIAAPGIGLQQAPSGTATEVTLRTLSIDGSGSDSSVVGNGGSLVLQAGWSVRSVVETPEVTARLERRTGAGEWTSTGIEASAPSDGPLTVRTPSYATSSAAETVQYRLASDTSASNPVSVVYENQAFYTGVARTMYTYVEQYCPHTAVRVTDLDDREAGLYGTGSLLIQIDSSVGLTNNVEPVNQRAVALHECSHELQWVNYGGTADGYEQMKTDAARLFSEGDNGAEPLEHAADCGAKAVNPEGYLGYHGYCTPGELEAGGRLLAGQRYGA